MNVARIIGHKEWANAGRKSDPKYSMDWRRGEVKNFVPRTSRRELGSRVLGLGDAGDDVAELQKLLGITPADGAFGPKTKAVVQAFQSANNLTADGVVGDATLAALNRNKPEVRPPFERENFDMILVDDPAVGQPVDSPKQYLCDVTEARWVKDMNEVRALVLAGVPHLTEKPETRAMRQAMLDARVRLDG